jgi:hypothetical protein
MLLIEADLRVKGATRRGPRADVQVERRRPLGNLWCLKAPEPMNDMAPPYQDLRLCSRPHSECPTRTDHGSKAMSHALASQQTT